MLSPPTLDDLLRSSHLDLYSEYRTIKRQLMANYQSRWCMRWPGGNDHGPSHIERVLQILVNLLGEDPIARGRITTFELFLAATAIVAHDIGIVDGRPDHAERSAEILAFIAKSNPLLFDEHSIRVLGAAIRCHSSHVDIERGCQDLSFTETFAGKSVRPRFIAALVRLSDELDEDISRATKLAERAANITPDSRPFWEFCQRIQGIRIDHTTNITFDVIFEKKDISKQVASDKGTVSFLHFFATKIAKINRERERMRPYLHELSRTCLLVSMKRPADASPKDFPTFLTPRSFSFEDGSCMTPEGEANAIVDFIGRYPELQTATKRRLSAVPANKSPKRQSKPAPPLASDDFIVGPVLTDPRRFFGRRDLIARIYSMVRKPPLQNVAIIGPTRSGKTSLLLHLRNLAILPADALRADQRDQCPSTLRAVRWAFVDFQSPGTEDPLSFMRHVLPQLGLSVAGLLTFESAYNAINQLDTPAIIMLDEVLVAIKRHVALDDKFWEALRSLTTAARGRIGFILSAKDIPQAHAASRGLGSPFFNIFGYAAYSGPLTESEARELIQSGPRPFPDPDVTWILGMSKCWPILLQVLCRERLAALEQGGPDKDWKAEALRQMQPFGDLLKEQNNVQP